MEIKRDFYLNEIKKRMHNGMIKIITGIRRCGKSYLLYEIFAAYLKDIGVPDSHIIKIDFEDRRNAKLRDPDELLHYIDSKMTDAQMYYILLDEVQHVAEFEDVLNSYLKINNADVYVTGSNSKFLSKDVITEFRGRGDEIKIAPLSFSEFYSVFQGPREVALANYITFGGLPKIIGMDNAQRQKYLSDLFITTYMSDIRERYNIRQEDEMMELLRIISSSIGGLTNPNKLMNTFKSEKKVSISTNTINNYLSILEDVFLVERSIRYDIKGKRYINTPSKFYFSDLGLRNACIQFRQNEPTHLYENLVYNELRRRGMQVDVGVVTLNTPKDGGGYNKVNVEVDFVCNCGDKRYYIQSAYRLPDELKMKQELRSLKAIGDNFAKFVITDQPMLRHQNDDGIVFMNFYDFLLDENSLLI